MIDLKLLTIVLCLLTYLYTTNINYNENVIIVEDVVFNVTRSTLFDFITNPDIFSKWFKWVTKVKFANHKLFEKGKKYHVYFTKTPILFEVNNLEIGDESSSVVLMADTILKPVLELKIIETCRNLKYPRLKVIMSIVYNRDSLLFTYTLGNVLRQITMLRMKESCYNLNKILDKFERINISKAF